MIRVALLSVYFVFISLTANADTTVNCSPKESKYSIYYRNISHAEFGEEVEVKDILRGVLLEHTGRVERIANWNREYSGPDSEYIPVLIGLLDERAGSDQEFSCLWSLYQSGDIVRKFSDYEPMVFRDGFGLFREGVLIGYFYSGIGVV